MSDMEDEIFDEPRRCPKCDIVTYCDTCPICGRKLPRTPYAIWKMKNRNKVAGEQEELAQPGNYRIHQGHIQQRELSSNHTKLDRDKEMEFGGQHARYAHTVKQSRTSDRYPPKQGQQKAIKDGKEMAKKISFTFAVAILILVVLITMGLSQYHEESYDMQVTQIGEIEDNYGDISVYNLNYRQSSHENILSIFNSGNRSFSADLYLYDQDHNEIGVYTDLYILPYEDFELTIYGDGAAKSYEFINTEFYDILTPEPSYSFSTFSNYGDIEIVTEKKIDENELADLIKYVYDASSFSEYDTMYFCTVEMPSGASYSVYIDETSANVYYHDEKGNLSDPFSFTLEQKTYQL